MQTLDYLRGLGLMPDLIMVSPGNSPASYRSVLCESLREPAVDLAQQESCKLRYRALGGFPRRKSGGPIVVLVGSLPNVTQVSYAHLLLVKIEHRRIVALSFRVLGLAIFSHPSGPA